MIYLIESKSINIKTNKIFDLLKIGYTDDKSSDNRFAAYKLHNPLSEILYKIPGGTKKDESNLLYKFRYNRYEGYGREWFYSSPDILDFFKINTTKQDLDKNLVKAYTTITPAVVKRINRVIRRLVNRWVTITSTKENLYENTKLIPEIEEKCKKEIKYFIMREEDVLEYLSYEYNIPKDIQKQLQDYLSGNIVLDKNIKEYLDKFNSKKTIHDKLEMLCTVDLTDTERSFILDQIPVRYKTYYSSIGPEKCRALSYNTTKLDKYLEDCKFEISKLKEEIYRLFEIGKRYTKSSIKSSLSDLYSSLGYNKTPKANDLEEYFVLKRCLISNKETNKRDEAFEIINKKD